MRPSLLALALTLPLALLALAQALRHTPSPPWQKADNASPFLRLQDVKIENHQEGSLRWQARARKALVHPQSLKAQLMDMEISVPQEGLLLRAREGLHDLQEGTLTTKGGVSIAAKGQGVRLQTSSLSIRPGGTAQASSEVDIRGQGFRIQGRGFLREGPVLKVLRDVKAVFY
jgi:hypothetical protein